MRRGPGFRQAATRQCGTETGARPMNRKVHAAQIAAVSALAFAAAAAHSVAGNDVLTAAVAFAILANLMPTRKT